MTGSAVDFDEWAAPGLTLTWRGAEYHVPPPTVEAAAQVLASAVLGEIKFGLVKSEVPDEVKKILAEIGTGHPALSQEVYDQMAADGVPEPTINRMSVYATFYWARGRQYADWIAPLLWGKPRDTAESGDAAPKG